MGFHGSRWVFMVFLDSRLIGHGSKWVLMVFHCSRLGFHCAMSVKGIRKNRLDIPIFIFSELGTVKTES